MQNTAVVYVKAPYEMADNAVVTALTFYGTVANICRQIHDFDENMIKKHQATNPQLYKEDTHSQ